jgi:hypothetical protein
MHSSSEITIRDFVAAADAGEPMRLLDVRNRDEFEALERRGAAAGRDAPRPVLRVRRG